MIACRAVTRAVGRILVVLSVSTSLTASAAPAPAPEPNGESSAPANADKATWVDPNREVEPAAVEPRLKVAPENYRLAIAGNVVTGLGVAAFVTMIVGFGIMSTARDELGYAQRREDEDAIRTFEKRERTGLIIGITGAAATGALFVTGLTLIGVGRQRERKRRAALSEQALVPLLSPRGAGLRWTLRF